MPHRWAKHSDTRGIQIMEETTSHTQRNRQSGRSAYSVDETAEKLGVERKTVYSGVRSGVIPSVKIGRRILIPAGYFGRLEDASQ